MEELLESLTKKAKLEAEESHRLLIAAINGQAGLCIIQEQVSYNLSMVSLTPSSHWTNYTFDNFVYSCSKYI